jgi:hypothetical protein
MAVEKVVDEEQEGEAEYVAVEEDPTSGKPTESQDDEGAEDDDSESDDETEGQEARLGGGREEDDDDDDGQKSRRRDENKTRRQRQREARQRTERELKFLQRRNEQLERRFSSLESDLDARVTGSEVANVEQAINKARSDLTLANQVIAQAAEANDGKNLAEALDHRDAIRDNLRELQQAKNYLSQQGARGAATQPQLDPRHIAHANKFMADNGWWDPQGSDRDSKRVLQIDRSLVQEGYDPASADYWDELRTRTRDAVPHRFTDGRAGVDDETNDDDDIGNRKEGNGKPNGKPKGRQNKGPQFRTGGRERPLKKNEVYISPERKQAMEEAGVWEDPVLRNKYLKAYSNYDRDNKQGVGA